MIGVFDSGLGGLTVLKALLNDEKLSLYDYLYFGDTARTPYGNKSEETIYRYTEKAVDFLFTRGCRLIILACNTASAKTLRRVQREYLPVRYPERRVLGVVIPAAEAAVEKSAAAAGKGARRPIGVIGTRSTVVSGVYEAEIKKLDPDAEVIGKACPLLVPLVEEGWAGKPETRMILKKYLRPLKMKNPGTLIPGCTHYPFLLKDIKRIMGKNTVVIDTPVVVREKLIDYLLRHKELEKEIGRGRGRKFYVTDDAERFRKIGEKFLNRGITEMKKVEI